MAAGKKTAEPILSLKSAAAWNAWLKKHHATSDAVLLRMDKTGAKNALSYAQAIDAALAWGWIDSQKRALDKTAWLQRFSRRSAKSPWSKINRDKAEALIARGAMHPAGLKEVERARADGRWAHAYDGARNAAVPDDLAAALSKNKRAKAFFETLDGGNRYAILWRVQTAKKAQTRADRIAKFVTMCAKGETIHPRSRSRAKSK